MIQPEDRIIVRVNMAQKNEFTIGGVIFKTAMRYEVNYREKSPVVASVVSGNNILQEGDIILCHHNHFYPPSPYYLYDDLYSIPFNKTIFCRLFDNRFVPICGNIIGTRCLLENQTSEEKKYHKDRIKVTDGGSTGYKERDLIFTRPSAPYDIVYIIDKIEHRITKVPADQVIGVEKKYFTNK